MIVAILTIKAIVGPYIIWKIFYETIHRKKKLSIGVQGEKMVFPLF